MVREGMRLDDGAGGSTMVDVTDGTAGGSSAGASSSAGGGSSSAGASGVAASAEGESDEEGGGLESMPEEPLARFHAHCKATNEIFGLAGKACARVLVQLESAEAAGTEMKTAYEAAMAPFAAGLKWWDAVATPDDVADEVDSAAHSGSSLTESWTLLAAVLGPHAPPGCPLRIGRRVRSHCRCLRAAQLRHSVASPVEEHFLLVDALDEAHELASPVTGPLLDALDESYALSFEGTGLFPLQATMNHHCEPNVTLLKEEAEEERDGRVVARLTRDVAEGEELCNSMWTSRCPTRSVQGAPRVRIRVQVRALRARGGRGRGEA